MNCIVLSRTLADNSHVLFAYNEDGCPFYVNAQDDVVATSNHLTEHGYTVVPLNSKVGQKIFELITS